VAAGRAPDPLVELTTVGDPRGRRAAAKRTPAGCSGARSAAKRVVAGMTVGLVTAYWRTTTFRTK
jgi:hypothetical protein